MMPIHQTSAMVLGGGAVCMLAPTGFSTAQFHLGHDAPDALLAALMRRGVGAGLVVLASQEGRATIVSVTGAHEAVVAFVERVQGGTGDDWT
jgi:hypothetical protein